MHEYPSINCCLLSFCPLSTLNMLKTNEAAKSGVTLSSVSPAVDFLKKKDKSMPSGIIRTEGI